MADLATLARPYAKAVFELARGADAEAPARWSATLKLLSEVVAQPQVAALIDDPRLPRAQLAALLCAALAGKVDRLGENLLRLLAENRRLPLLPAIVREYERLRAEAEARVEVEIATAAEVPEAQRQALVAAVARRLQRQVQAHWRIEPALLAGAVVRAGDLVIDGSVAGELARLRRDLVS